MIFLLRLATGLILTKRVTTTNTCIPMRTTSTFKEEDGCIEYWLVKDNTKIGLKTECRDKLKHVK